MASFVTNVNNISLEKLAEVSTRRPTDRFREPVDQHIA